MIISIFEALKTLLLRECAEIGDQVEQDEEIATIETDKVHVFGCRILLDSSINTEGVFRSMWL